MRARSSLAVAALALSLSPATLAQTTKPSEPAPQKSPAPSQVKKPAPPTSGAKARVRRDPNGIKGISPYMEELAKGRRAFAANDLPGAIAAFDAAITKDKERLLAYLLKAQAQLATGDLEAAHATAATGRTKQGSEAEQSKLLLLSAELDERRANSKPGADNEPGTLDKLEQKWAAVKEAWGRYLAFVAAHPQVPDHRATAEERQSKIDARVQRDKDYSAVKKRIAENEAEHERERQKDHPK
jgi:hypothetical protein